MNCRNCGAPPRTYAQACEYCGTLTVAIRNANAKPGAWPTNSASYNPADLQAVSENLNVSPAILLGGALAFLLFTK